MKTARPLSLLSSAQPGEGGVDGLEDELGVLGHVGAVAQARARRLRRTNPRRLNEEACAALHVCVAAARFLAPSFLQPKALYCDDGFCWTLGASQYSRVTSGS